VSGLLDRTRERLGPAPRWLPAQGLRPKPPPWMSKRDPRYGTYADTDHLLAHGDVVWGHMVQANGALFEPGKADLPGDVIFAEDRSLDEALDRLHAAAHAAASLTEVPLAHGAYKRLGDHLTQGTGCAVRLPVPAGVGRGATLFLSTIVIHRRLLPMPYLATMFLPLLVSPYKPSVMPLPSPLWAEDLVEAWRDVAAETWR
jgi:hypothetical protein